MNVTISTNAARAARERVLSILEKNNGAGSASEFIVEQAELRLESEITARTSYTFNLFENQSSLQSPTEIKLNRNNAFFVTHIGLFVASEVTGTGAIPLGNTRLFAYPDPVVYTTALIRGSVEAIYNSKMSFSTQPVDRMQEFSTSSFRYEPFANTATGSGGAWGPSQEERGLFPLSGEIILSGKQDNSIKIEMPSNADLSNLVGVTDRTNYLVVKLFGHKVVNGAQSVGLYM